MMKIENESIGAVSLVVEDVKASLADEDTKATLRDIKRPGRLPRLTDGLAAVEPVPVEDVPVEGVPVEEEPVKYLMPDRPLTLDEIRHYLEHPEELKIAGIKDEREVVAMVSASL